MIEISDCLEVHRRTEWRLQEQKSVVIFENPDHHEIAQIAVDGCVIKVGERCDWLIIVNGKDMSIFVELKGSDIDKAYGQLVTSHRLLIDHVKRHRAWIISYSGSPRFNTTIQNLTLRARSDHRTRLLVKSSPYGHTL